MKKYLILLLLSILLIVPIAYISLCINYDLNILKSYDLILQVYNEIFIEKRKLETKAYISLVWGFLPFLVLHLYMWNSRMKPSYGYAKFATLSIIKKMKGLSFKKGFVLGKFKGKKLFSNDPLSMCVFAPPSAGKTSAIVIPNLLTLPQSSIVTDIKAELYKKTSQYRKEKLGNEIYVFSPYGTDNNYNFNPFAKELINDLIFDDKMVLVKEIANVIFEKEQGDPHWSESAKMIFIMFAIYDIEKKGETNLYELQRYPKKSAEELLTPEYQELKQMIEEEQEIVIDDLKMFFKQVTNDEDINLITSDYARSLERTNSKEFKSIVSTYSRKMDIFTDNRIKEIVSSNSFPLNDLKKKNITIYTVMKEKDIPALTPLIKVWKKYIIQNLMEEENTNENERVIFYEDEFIRLGKIESLVEAPALARGYNLKFIYIAQNPSQVTRVYSPEHLKELMGSVAYNIFFAMSDVEEAERTAKAIGNLTRNKVSENSQATKLFGSKNKSQEGYGLITPQDLLNLKDDEVLILVYRHTATPIKAKVNYWFKDSSLKRIVSKYGL